MPTPHASKQTITQTVIRLDLSQCDAQNLLTLLTAMTAQNRDNFGFLLSTYGLQVTRDIKDTVYEVKKALDAVTIPATPAARCDRSY